MIGIVVPAHDEEETLDACIASLRLAACHPQLDGEAVRIVIVLDACTDDSAAIARRAGVDVLEVAFTNVGLARHRGANWLIDQGARWLAFTDADTVVEADWLVHQLASRADAVCGGVHLLDWANLSQEIRRRYLAHRRSVADGRHIHGANLGVSVAAYLAVGGFAPLVAHEDVKLVGTLQQHGFTIDWLQTMRVKTSSRRNARAPEGMGALLRSLERNDAGIG
ncbi:glycosyltransferase family A protein [Salinicola sp. CPA57]|uniref:glycosyltransferase n=1 Tax=Salinicola sp. CPA57 TaxID=1949080 RepID=UPI000DA1688C|nr:glycosyltransferase family A protein [Salinicola sp. CPA57]